MERQLFIQKIWTKYKTESTKKNAQHSKSFFLSIQ